MTGIGPGPAAIGPVFIVGPGRAGRSVGTALLAVGVPVTGLHGRARPFPPALAGAAVVLVATPDAAIGGTLDELAHAGLAASAVVLQLSGVREPDGADARLRAVVAGVGTFHPLVPLADPALGPERMHGACVGVGGDSRAIAVATAIAERIGARTLPIPDVPNARALYHAAAVFASNFPVVLAAVAARLFVASGVDARSAHSAAAHLLASSAANVAAADLEASRGPASALTGPIARGDVDTVARHLAALAADGDASALYRALGLATVDLVRAARDVRGLDAIRGLLR